MSYQIVIHFETDKDLNQNDLDLLMQQCLLQIEEPWNEHQELADWNTTRYLANIRNHKGDLNSNAELEWGLPRGEPESVG